MTPDIRGREDILKVHSVGKPLGEDVNLATIAKTTSGFTGADLENLLNEAALLSARRNKKTIGMQEIEDATIKVVVGPEKKTRVISDKEKKLTAYHEAGHAIATYAHPRGTRCIRFPSSQEAGRGALPCLCQRKTAITCPKKICLRKSWSFWAGVPPRKWCWTIFPPGPPTIWRGPAASPGKW
jgi:hypothetical protein